MNEKRVVVVYGFSPAPPSAIGRAAKGLASLVFVADRREPHVNNAWDLLGELAEEVFDLAEMSLEEIAEKLRGNVSGITTFTEPMMGLTADLALLLGLHYHTREVVALVTDKALQRNRLNEAGAASVQQRRAMTAADFSSAIADLGFPVVIKPRNGRGGIDTFLCEDERVYAVAVADLLSRRALNDDGWVVEEFMRPGRHPVHKWLGDYCSVESAVQGDNIWHYAITDKLPLAEPFRETGFVLPTIQPVEFQQMVRDIATLAIKAVGITDGLVHTELKFTPDGIKVIEVNGRLGGFINIMIPRVTDLLPVRLGLELALGVPLEVRELEFAQTTFNLNVVPPHPHRVRVISLPALPALRGVPGVWKVERHVMPGAVLDWRKGTNEAAVTIWADAASPADVIAALTEFDRLLSEQMVLEPIVGD